MVYDHEFSNQKNVKLNCMYVNVLKLLSSINKKYVLFTYLPIFYLSVSQSTIQVNNEIHLFLH